MRTKAKALVTQVKAYVWVNLALVHTIKALTGGTKHLTTQAKAVISQTKALAWRN